MKYFPLIWAALWRRPARAILTLLSVSVAFTLFGVMIGFNASIQNLIALSHPDRVLVNTRYGGYLPLAYKDQIARLPGVTKVTYIGAVPGYYRDRKNNLFVLMGAENFDTGISDLPLTPAQWTRLHATPNGIFVSQLMAARFHLEAGDQFPVLTAAAAGVARQDGNPWPFTVLGTVPDIAQDFNGYLLGNYDYWDQSRPPAQRGKVVQFIFLVSNPDQAGATAKAVDAMFANSPVPTNTISQKDAVEGAAQAGINIPFVTTVVASAGLFMILFLTGNGIAQSVRERIPEFAVLKTLGFSDAGVMALVFAEAAIPCLLGAAIGIGVAKAFAQALPKLFPPNLALPVPYMSPGVLSLAFVFAAIVAFLSAVLPALRIRRLDVATALSGR